jgi:predicted nucleic acid-binding protein
MRRVQGGPLFSVAIRGTEWRRSFAVVGGWAGGRMSALDSFTFDSFDDAFSGKKFCVDWRSSRREGRLAKNDRGGYTGNMAERLYLDNCSFNRPYDDQSLLKNRLESEAKIYIQREILSGTYELAWSYIMDYEISFNPFADRKNQIVKWKKLAKIDVDISEDVDRKANEITARNIKPKDALHIACALEAKCGYFITTDKKILNKTIDHIAIINPIDFVRMKGDEK